MTSFFKNNLYFLIGLILTGSLLWPLFASSYFSHHDDVQIIRLYEMDKCIKDSQIPCRWVPDLGGMYGYPLFNYYAPLPYYFGELIFLISNNLILAVKFMFATAFVGSYIFMYLLAQKLWGKPGALLSGVFYSLAPYHAVVFYVRGAMGELWALMLFPAIYWAILRLRQSKEVINVLLSGLFVAMLILSHNLSTMLFLPIMLGGIGLLFFKERDVRFVKYCAVSILLSLLLSAFYLLPMIFEKNLVHVETTTFGYFSYTEHFKGIRKLFLDRSWGWGASVREVPGGERDGMSFQIGWVHLLGWLVALYLLKLSWRENRSTSRLILTLSLVTLFCIYMVNPRSEFIWKIISPLKYVQFPWRFLMLIIFFVSLMAGSMMRISAQRKNLILAAVIFLVVVFNFSYFRPEKFFQTTTQELLSGQNWDRQIKRSIFDFLPIYAEAPPEQLATSRYEILTGETEILNYHEGTNWISFQTNTRTHSIVRLSQYYFPDWKIEVDGQAINIDYKNSLGLMTFILGEGTHNIKARFHDTPIRSFANLLTFLGLIMLGVLFILTFKKMRSWILYYLQSLHR